MGDGAKKRSRPSTTSASPSARASSSVSSGPTGPGRRRSSGSSRPCSRRRAVQSASRASTSRRMGRQSAASSATQDNRTPSTQDSQEENMTIFLTTQYMEEADQLCQRIAIIDLGKIVAEGSPAQLKAAIGADIITVRIARDEAFEQSRSRALEIARTIPGVSRATIFDEGVAAYTADGGGTLLEVLRRLDAEKVPAHQVALAHPTLDEVFLQHTGRQMRVEEVKPMSRSFGRRRR